ncbi:MAG: ribonuclease HI family protein [Deltaproteobacteria bacterium]|nr:ribonuclease HI family protein [Deltaproteobacteria bacterium]
MKKAILYTDGASRGNPGESGAGVILYDSHGEVLCEITEYLGRGTNNQAEYKAFIIGLKKAKKLEIQDLTVKMDSELIVRQLKGEYKVKNEGLLSLFLEAKKLILQFRSLKVEHVPRKENKEADRLANEALDER